MSDETPGAGQSAVPPREGLAPKPPVRIAQMAGGQFIVTTQSTNSAISQINTSGNQQRILTLSPSRANQTPPLRPSLTNQSIVKALTKARPVSNARQQLFQNADGAPATGARPAAPKRPFPAAPEKKDSYAAKQQRVLNHRIVRSKIVREKYNEHLLETYHLEMGGNLLDLYQFAKRPRTAQFQLYMQENSIEPKEADDVSTLSIPSATAASSLPGSVSSNNSNSSTPDASTPSSTPTHTNATSSTVNASSMSSSGGHTSTPKPQQQSTTAPDKANLRAPKPPTQQQQQQQQPVQPPAPPPNPEQIVEKAKHEAWVVQRIGELQKVGLWSEKRLPKVQEMPRAKAHWDFLLEEMVWLAADFAQERKWKKAAAKKCARMVQKYFQDKAQAAQKAEKAHEQHMRRVAAFVAKEVKLFWGNVEKLVEYKQNTRLEEKRKQALDQHLSFIVDQTEKYSQLLAEGMNKTQNSVSNPASNVNSDVEFEPDAGESTDDEETIAQEEARDQGEKTEEIAALQRESQLDFDDFLSELPKDYLANRDKIVLSESEEDADSSTTGESTSAKKGADEDFMADSSGEDDEDTIQEQEKAEGEQDHEAEIDDLNEEAEMDIEELRRKYANLPSPPPDEDNMSVDEPSESTAPSERATSSDNESEDEIFEDAEAKPIDDKDIGLKSLLDTSRDDSNSDQNDLINDAAAIAESLQPKGNTLSSASVVTPIPFLLKLTLREYQHIGLDWLVTMFDRKLNGILADEMGLGKTIQTIALLAHLACEKSNWGPHLIVVPTSVMLNWEMECKKWCPGFKILTYYGSQKERKLKRTGWTKPNAFHICITSYKLVIQDHQSFRRKKWRYLILDEAQNIKNFKSQRWQLLLNFQSQQRLLLTGTPLQNNLMELWSLMHFLMPNVFQSHREFKEWFSNPVTGMIEGNTEYNENIIKRLHKVLRPFLLRRLKCEVEKQMPKKFEHVVMCRLSKRQRFLYDDYMSRAQTKETLTTGNLLSVINVLMQLRKVCNHPNLFEPRPTISPFHCDGIVLHVPSLVYAALEYDLWKEIDLISLNFNLLHLELTCDAYRSFRLGKYQVTKKLIEEISSNPVDEPVCPPSRLTLKVHRASNESKPPNQSAQKVKLMQHGLKAVQLASSPAAQPIQISNVLKPSVPGYAQLVQTSTGKHILLTPTCNLNSHTIGVAGTTTVMTSTGHRLTVLPKQAVTTTTPASQAAIAKAVVKVQLTSLPATNSGGSAVSPSEADSIDAEVVSAIEPTVRRKPIDTKFIERLYMQQPKTDALDVRWQQRLRRGANDAYHATDDGVGGDDYGCADAGTTRLHRLDMLARINRTRCAGVPIYGREFIDVVRSICADGASSPWASGAHACRDAQYGRWPLHTPQALKDLIYTPTKLIDELMEIFDRYIVYVPSAHAPEPELQAWNPSPSLYWGRFAAKRMLARQLSAPTKLLHPIASAMITQFPQPRLIQYDCGKLQRLDRLLRQLKTGGHRVLIFTQMTKMLDVLEAFLNFHGHIYLRLDGSTKIDQRQLLMERFNADTRIFAFILSTRSGGVGINLTGADTVIFYDSDWNPTMDAQAQDRCHRIGQTRDVHIYRLVSEMTIEENILKKANQKRLLGDLAIEGGNFTTAYFKTSTIQDLFTIDKNESSAANRMSEVVEVSREREKQTAEAANEPATGVFEKALAAAEDDQDVVAAREAQAEAVADLAEFDENIPLDDPDRVEKEPEMSKAEQEVENLIKQLTPIERYAMKFIEETESAWSEEQLAAAEREIEEKKREWEENRLASMREEEERRARELEEDSEMLTFSREDATNQIWVNQNTNEHMPMWCPPTPPQQEGDMYVDHTMSFLYDTSAVMTETQLPAVYIKKEPKRSRMEAGLADHRRPAKVHKRDDVAQPPKTIFERSPMAVKMRRESRFQKYRGLIRPTNMPPIPGVKYPLGKLSVEQPGLNWTIHEDNAILKVIQSYQGLNLNLLITCPANTPNWDFVADYVNTVSVMYRSPKQCRNRYENVLISREEGKQIIDNSPRKKKQKTSGGMIYPKFPVSPKSSRPMRTAQLYIQDNNNTFTTLTLQRFDAFKTAVAKKSATFKPPTVTSTIATKNPKHEAILTEAGIDLEKAVNATDIAVKLAERISREKSKPDQMQMQKLHLLRQVQAAAVQSQQNAATAAAEAARAAAANTATTSTAQTSSQPTLQVSQQPAPQQQQQQQQPQVQQQVVQQAVVTQTIVTTVQSPPITTVVSTSSPSPSTPPNTLRMQRIVAASPLQNQSVVSVSGISAAHLQGTQRLIVSGAPGQQKATVVGTGPITGKTISQAQLQMLRNTALKQQQAHQAQMRLQGAIAPQAIKTTAVVTIPGSTAVQVQFTQAQPRHIIKGGTVAVANKQMTRTLTDSEVAQFLKLNKGKLAAQATTIANPQVFAQALQAGPSGTQVATIVKAVSSSGVTQAVIGTPVKALPQGIKPQQATPQQIRSLQIQQLMAQKKLLNQQKIAGIGQVGKAGVATQLIVGSKPISTAMTMQQLHHVIRNPMVPQGPVVLATKGGSPRVIPVNTGQGTKPTIQVVAAQSPGLTTTIRPPTSSSTITAASLAGLKVQGASGASHGQQQALLSQVSAMLGQNVRQGSPVRIQTTAGGTPVVAVSMQSASNPAVVQVQQQQQQCDKSDHVSRFLKKQ